MGMERLMAALECENISVDEEDGIDAYIIPIDTLEYSMALVTDLRLLGFKAEIDYMNRKMQNNFKQADRLNAKFIIIVGEEEIEKDTLTIKDNHTKEEYKVPLDGLMDFLDDNLSSCGCGDNCHCHK